MAESLNELIYFRCRNHAKQVNLRRIFHFENRQTRRGCSFDVRACIEQGYGPYFAERVIATVEGDPSKRKESVATLLNEDWLEAVKNFFQRFASRNGEQFWSGISKKGKENAMFIDVKDLKRSLILNQRN